MSYKARLSRTVLATVVILGLSNPLNLFSIFTFQPAIAALSPVEVNKKAKEVTVMIQALEDPNLFGSGVIVRKSGNTYTVLTANHVVSGSAQYTVMTSDEVQYTLKNIQPLPEVDMAIATFESTVNYAVAQMGDSNALEEGQAVFISGFPKASEGFAVIQRQFVSGNITAIIKSGRAIQQGYSLAYNNLTRAGMSGGPVFNEDGQLIAIHGRTSTPDKTWVNMGMPINFFKTASLEGRVASRPTAVLPPPPQPAPQNTPTPAATTSPSPTSAQKPKPQPSPSSTPEIVPKPVATPPTVATTLLPSPSPQPRPRPSSKPQPSPSPTMASNPAKTGNMTESNQSINLPPTSVAKSALLPTPASDVPKPSPAAPSPSQPPVVSTPTPIALATPTPAPTSLAQPQPVLVAPPIDPLKGIQPYIVAIAAPKLPPVAAPQCREVEERINTIVVRKQVCDGLGESTTPPSTAKRPEDYMVQGNASLASGNLNQAINAYNEAIDLKEDYAEAYFNRGYAYYKVGKTQKAIADFSQAAQLFEKQKRTSDLEQVKTILAPIQKQNTI